MGRKKKNTHSCPKCRCKKVERTGNMVSYPDHWEQFFCSHCNWKVGEIDNSSYISCWEFPDRIIEI